MTNKKETTGVTTDGQAINSISRTWVDWVDSVIEARDELALAACVRGNLLSADVRLNNRSDVNVIASGLSEKGRDFLHFNGETSASITYKNMRFSWFEV